MFVELRKLESCIRTWENEEKRKRGKGGLPKSNCRGFPMSNVQCGDQPKWPPTSDIPISWIFPCQHPARPDTQTAATSDICLYLGGYPPAAHCAATDIGVLYNVVQLVVGLVLADIGLKWSQSGYPIQASSWPWVPLSVSAPLQYRFSHMFVHCANISRSKSKLWSICNSVHVCHLLSAGNPPPQADGCSPYIALTCIIPHLNIVLTIKFGSFLFVGSFLLVSKLGSLQKQRSVPNSCQRAACHLVW